MAYDDILYHVDDRVAWLTINQPDKMNAITRLMRKEIPAALAEAEADPDVRVIVIKGAGDRAFSSGMDIQTTASEEPQGPDFWAARIGQDQKFFKTIFNCSKPTIAMIHGYCLAGAIDIALMCDMRYCSDQARFGLTETRFASGCLALPEFTYVIGQRCRELIYTGDMFDAAEAYRLGLVNRTFPKERLEEEVTRLAKRISRVAMPTLQWNKKGLNHVLVAAGLESAARYSLETCVRIDGSESEFTHFFELAKTDFKAALEWRDSLFAPFESETSALRSRKPAKQPENSN